MGEIKSFNPQGYRPPTGELRYEYRKKQQPSLLKTVGIALLRHTAGRIDALLLKIPSLIFVGLLQSAKIAIKFAVCVITFNQSRHICEDWSFSGLEKDTGVLLLYAEKTFLAAKDVIFAPNEDYKPSFIQLFEGLGHVFVGKYHGQLGNIGLKEFVSAIAIHATHKF